MMVATVARIVAVARRKTLLCIGVVGAHITFAFVVLFDSVKGCFAGLV